MSILDKTPEGFPDRKTLVDYLDYILNEADDYGLPRSVIVITPLGTRLVWSDSDFSDSNDSDLSDFSEWDDVDLIDYWFQSTGLVEGTQYITDHSANTYIVPFVSVDWRHDFKRRAKGGMYLGGHHTVLDKERKGR